MMKDETRNLAWCCCSIFWILIDFLVFRVRGPRTCQASGTSKRTRMMIEKQHKKYVLKPEEAANKSSKAMRALDEYNWKAESTKSSIPPPEKTEEGQDEKTKDSDVIGNDANDTKESSAFSAAAVLNDDTPLGSVDSQDDKHDSQSSACHTDDIECGSMNVQPNMEYSQGDTDDAFAAAIEASRGDVVPGAFREGFGSVDEDSTTAWNSLSTEPNSIPQDHASRDGPSVPIAKAVDEPEPVTATLEESMMESASISKHASAVHSKTCKRRVLLLLLIGTLVIIGLVVGIVMWQKSVSTREDTTSGERGGNTASRSTEPFELLGAFSDDEEGVDPDLTGLNVSVSRNHVAFDLSYKDSETTDPYTVRIDMKARSGGFDRLELNNGKWILSKLDPLSEEVVSGIYTIVGDDERKNARIEVDRSCIPDLLSKQLFVYCGASNDRMPDIDSSPSYYTLKETSTGMFGVMFDAIDDAERSPDFASFSVFVDENFVELILEFDEEDVEDNPIVMRASDQSFLGFSAIISIDGPPSIGPFDRLTVRSESASWNARRILEGLSPHERNLDDDLDHVDVFISSLRSGILSAVISFPRRKIPDLMTRHIVVYSEKSKDRLPDTGDIPLLDENSLSCLLEASVACLLPSEAPCSSLSSLPPSFYTCSLPDLLVLGWIFSGGTCVESTSTQIGFDCTDSTRIDVGLARIIATGTTSGNEYANELVALDRMFTMETVGGLVIDSGINVTITSEEGKLLQTMIINSECTVENDLTLGKTFGAFTFGSYGNRDTLVQGFQEAAWTYTAANAGSTAIKLTMSLNTSGVVELPSAGRETVPAGEEYPFTVHQLLNLIDPGVTYTGSIEVSGKPGQCNASDSDSVTFSVLP